jgi:hypothetical protein
MVGERYSGEMRGRVVKSQEVSYESQSVFEREIKLFKE